MPVKSPGILLPLLLLLQLGQCVHLREGSSSSRPPADQTSLAPGSRPKQAESRTTSSEGAVSHTDTREHSVKLTAPADRVLPNKWPFVLLNTQRYENPAAGCWVVTSYFPDVKCGQPSSADQELCSRPGSFATLDECCAPQPFHMGCSPATVAAAKASTSSTRVDSTLVKQVKTEVGILFNPADVDPGGNLPPSAATSPEPAPAPVSPPTPMMSCLPELLAEPTFKAIFPQANLHADPNVFDLPGLYQAGHDFPAFGNAGGAMDMEPKQKELAAFLAHVSQTTSGWWPGQAFEWGLVYSREQGCAEMPNACLEYNLCYGELGRKYPCAVGERYYGRGPLMLKYNVNYGKASRALYGDDRLLLRPELVATDPTVAWQVALWQWMTPQGAGRPSAHDAFTTPGGSWDSANLGLMQRGVHYGDFRVSAAFKPTPPPSAPGAEAEEAEEEEEEVDPVKLLAGRHPGFGASINALAGETECGRSSKKADNRIQYYVRSLGLLNYTFEGEHLDCEEQQPYPPDPELPPEGLIQQKAMRPPGTIVGPEGFGLPGSAR